MRWSCEGRSNAKYASSVKQSSSKQHKYRLDFFALISYEIDNMTHTAEIGFDSQPFDTFVPKEEIPVIPLKERLQSLVEGEKFSPTVTKTLDSLRTLALDTRDKVAQVAQIPLDLVKAHPKKALLAAALLILVGTVPLALEVLQSLNEVALTPFFDTLSNWIDLGPNEFISIIPEVTEEILAHPPDGKIPI